MPALLSAAERQPATTRIPSGKGELTIPVDAYKLKVFTYRPKNYSADVGPLLMVFHGHSRNPDAYRDHAVELGDACGGLVVAPYFDETQFPDRAYNHGNVLVQGKVQPKDKWTFSLVSKLIEKIRASEGRAEMPYYLLGHSGGGQFVERLMALTELKPIRAVAANPGSHLFPSRELDFPYGFGGLPQTLSDDNALKAYLAAPLTIYLGTADTDPNDPDLDRSKTALQEGPNRLVRGHRCFDLAKELAAIKGWDFNWRMAEATGVGHSAGKMFSQSACNEALFGTHGPK
jgi:poly(3-hydroxybutyrate) depolymerase